MMLEYSLTKPSEANFTPASLMNEIAKAGHCECFNGFWGGCVMMVNSVAYTFDHWHIEPRTDRPGWDSVTVYLAPHPRESWIDVQSRALYQAAQLVLNAAF